MKIGILNDKRYILKKSNAISSNYHNCERVYDTVLKKELYNSEIVDLLNSLTDEKKRQRFRMESDIN